MDVLTPSGPARLTWHGAQEPHPTRPVGLLLLGHGAGGGITAPDLVLTSKLAEGLGLAVGLVEQPYRVAGRRSPAPAGQLDAALTAVVAAARDELPDVPLIVGGRSSGARVACRTAQTVGAQGVLALAFPLRPPGRERPSRLPELVGAGVPVLVIQGERDPFGSADQLREALAAAADEQVVVSAATGADHALRKGIDTAEITNWLAGFLP